MQPFYHLRSVNRFILSGNDVEVAKMLKSRSTCLKIRRTWQPILGLALVGVGAFAFASCSTVLSDMPAQMGGLPEGTPDRQANPPAYPAVHDMPPPRPNAVLTEAEKKKVEAELAALRAEQARRAARGTVE